MIAIVDLETDSLDIKTARPLEVACVLVDVPTLRVVWAVSEVVRWDDLIVDAEITAINGINERLTRTARRAVDEVMRDTAVMMSCARAIVGHNAVAYDKPIMERYAELPKIPWIDTKTDLPLQKKTTSRRLGHLCADYGIAPRGAHEALGDCLAVVELLKFFNVEELVEMAEYRVGGRVRVNG